MMDGVKVKNPMGSAQMAAGLEVRGERLKVKIQKWDLGIFGIKVTLKP